MTEGKLKVVYTVPAATLAALALNADEQRLDSVVRRYKDLEKRIEDLIAGRDRVTRILSDVAELRGIDFAELVSGKGYGAKLKEGGGA